MLCALSYSLGAHCRSVRCIQHDAQYNFTNFSHGVRTKDKKNRKKLQLPIAILYARHNTETAKTQIVFRPVTWLLFSFAVRLTTLEVAQVTQDVDRTVCCLICLTYLLTIAEDFQKYLTNSMI